MMKFQFDSQRIFSVDEQGKLLAEVTFPSANGVADIDHTFVDTSLRGQGVAAQLMEAVTTYLRQQGMKAIATCPYAIKWFDQHPEQSDLLAPKP